MTPAPRLAPGAELTAAALHRMSQPLTVLRGTAELALTRPLDPPQFREAMLTMARETERLVALAEALRALNAPVGASPPADANLSLEAELAPLAEAKQVRVEIAAGPPAAWTEPLLQLARGALARARNRLVVRTEAEGAGTANVVIEDDGAALDPGGWARAFDPFAAGAEIASAARAALAVRRIEAMGGRLACGPAPAGGNRLTVAIRA